MARETKAERVAREAQARLQQEAALVESYPARLMAMLERAVKQNYELTVRDAKFDLEDRDDRHNSYVFGLTLVYSKENEDTLNELDWRLNSKEEAEREALRRVQVRNAALNKLSQEEREVLGI